MHPSNQFAQRGNSMPKLLRKPSLAIRLKLEHLKWRLDEGYAARDLSGSNNAHQLARIVTELANR
jgi:hypothetical protein